MKFLLHGNSTVPYSSALHEAHAGVSGDPVEYHPSRQSKFLLTSASEAPCGFFYYSAATENSNRQQMPITSLFVTSQNIHNWITQPCSIEVIARIGGAAPHRSDHNSKGQRFAMGTQGEHPGQHIGVNNLPVLATLSCTALKPHEGSLRDLMSGPSWILAELIGAVPKGQKKRPSSLFVCMDSSLGQRVEEEHSEKVWEAGRETLEEIYF